MTDAELLAASSVARGLAHRAATQGVGMDHKGRRYIFNHTTAYADRASEFSKLMQELRKRGLDMPPCDCPPEDHAHEKANP